MLHKTIFVPRVSYAAHFWHREAVTWVNRNFLVTIQRRALLGISSDYRTSLSSALQVVTGKFPQDLQVQFQGVVQTSCSLLPGRPPFSTPRLIQPPRRHLATPMGFGFQGSLVPQPYPFRSHPPSYPTFSEFLPGTITFRSRGFQS